MTKEYINKTLIVIRNEGGLPVRERFSIKENSDPDDKTIRYKMVVDVWDHGWEPYTGGSDLKLTTGCAGYEHDSETREVFDGDDIAAKLDFIQSWESSNLEESFESSAIVQAIQSRRGH